MGGRNHGVVLLKALDEIVARARAKPTRIALSDGADARVVEAALRAVRQGIAQPVLVGDTKAVRAALLEQGIGLDQGCVAIEDPAQSHRFDAYANAYQRLRRGRGVARSEAEAVMRTPLGYAAMMVRAGDADATLGGAAATTADTVRAAIQIIGMAPGERQVSSFFLMMLCEPHHEKKGAFVFADCGLIIEPGAAELAGIALASAASYERLTGRQAKVAMLSFSTAGSAAHARIDRVVEACRLAKHERPDLAIDGELQFDAAFIQSVASAKAPGAATAGNANVFVFPSLEAGNIGYKIAQRIGGAKAIGPILQGLAKPANDLSRGCSPQDVFNLMAITTVSVDQGMSAQ